MKNENTDTINRAIHSAMGFECWHELVEQAPRRCSHCERFDPPLCDYTIPGQPLEDAKAWCVNQFGAVKFGKYVYEFVGSKSIVTYATLPALDMANIIFGLINEEENK